MNQRQLSAIGKINAQALRREALGAGQADVLQDHHGARAARERDAMREVIHLAGSICARYRSEEHTSELQSLMRISYAVFCLKKKKKTKQYIEAITIKEYRHTYR